MAGIHTTTWTLLEQVRMKCPECNAALTCKDSRPHNFNTTKRRRHCSECDYVANSIEVLLPEETMGTGTAHTTFRIMQAANGGAEADRIAEMLRALADNLEKRHEQT